VLEIWPIRIFSLLTERAPCGLVLDIGHVWTVCRYSGRWRSQTVGKFLDEVLASFPLSRVVQINMAGLANHPNELDSSDDVGSLLPPWIDAHGAKVPQVLFDMLGQVLAHPGLTNLKGVAMEVDTKPIPLIVDEYRRFIERYGWWERQERRDVGWPVVETRSLAREPSSARMAVEPYQIYAQVASGQVDRQALSLVGQLADDDGGLERYQKRYLPDEICVWGGDLREMFPRTCEGLCDVENAFSEFFTFWFREPRATKTPFDYFLVKIYLFVEFIEGQYPELQNTAHQEAGLLREGYQLANSL